MDLPDQVDLPDHSSDETITSENSEDSVEVVQVDSENDIKEGQEQLEEALAEVEAPTEVEAPAEVEAPTAEIEPVQYESVQHVVSSLEDLSPEVRAHVEPVLSLIQTAHEDYKVAVEKYQEARKELQDFATEMKDYGVESDVVVERFESQQRQIQVLNNACVDTTWKAFSRLHPEYSGLTQKTKNIFSGVVGSMLNKFPGDSTLDKLEEAYKYAQYTSGETARKKAEAAKPVAPPVAETPVAQSKPVNIDSKAQSLVADGTTPLSNPVLDVGDLSMNEILNRHLHLLE